jgi:hypothetical protein
LTAVAGTEEFLAPSPVERVAHRAGPVETEAWREAADDQDRALERVLLRCDRVLWAGVPGSEAVLAGDDEPPEPGERVELPRRCPGVPSG